MINNTPVLHQWSNIAARFQHKPHWTGQKGLCAVNFHARQIKATGSSPSSRMSYDPSCEPQTDRLEK